MNASLTAKMAILCLVILGVISASIAFAVWHHDDGDNRVRFQLTNHLGENVTQDDLGGSHLLVFFGFTSCHNVCPTQMTKLSQVMASLDQTGHGSRIKPVFISVDPERDTPQKVAEYLTYFDDRFVGLTGSRIALKSAADSFKTLLESLSADNSGDYQITHSSVTYIVDPFSRIVDYVPGSAGHDVIVETIREII